MDPIVFDFYDTNYERLLLLHEMPFGDIKTIIAPCIYAIYTIDKLDLVHDVFEIASERCCVADALKFPHSAQHDCSNSCNVNIKGISYEWFMHYTICQSNIYVPKHDGRIFVLSGNQPHEFVLDIDQYGIHIY